MKRFTRVLAVAAIAAAWGVPAGAQVPVHQPGAPVDQAVGDLDPLSRSFRRIDQGIARFGPNGTLRPLVLRPGYGGGSWQMDPQTGLPMSQVYVYEAPGVRAFIQRPEYLVLTPEGLGRNVSPVIDGAFRPMAGANVVYDLVPRSPVTRVREADPDWVDRRIDSRPGGVGFQRIDTRIDGRVNRAWTGNRTLHAPEAERVEPLPQEIRLPLVRPQAVEPVEPVVVEPADEAPAE